MLQTILIRGEGREESVQTVNDNDYQAITITTMALSFMYSTGTRACTFSKVQNGWSSGYCERSASHKRI